MDIVIKRQCKVAIFYVRFERVLIAGFRIITSYVKDFHQNKPGKSVADYH